MTEFVKESQNSEMNVLQNLSNPSRLNNLSKFAAKTNFTRNADLGLPAQFFSLLPYCPKSSAAAQKLPEICSCCLDTLMLPEKLPKITVPAREG